MVGTAGFEPATNGSTVRGSARFPRDRRNDTLLSYVPCSSIASLIAIKGLLSAQIYSAESSILLHSQDDMDIEVFESLGYSVLGFFMEKKPLSNIERAVMPVVQMEVQLY